MERASLLAKPSLLTRAAPRRVWSSTPRPRGWTQQGVALSLRVACKRVYAIKKEACGKRSCVSRDGRVWRGGEKVVKARGTQNHNYCMYVGATVFVFLLGVYGSEMIVKKERKKGSGKDGSLYIKWTICRCFMSKMEINA